MISSSDPAKSPPAQIMTLKRSENSIKIQAEHCLCLGGKVETQGKPDAHLLEVQVAILEVVSSDGAALIQHDIVPKCDQLKITHIQGINVAPLADASTLHTIFLASAQTEAADTSGQAHEASTQSTKHPAYNCERWSESKLTIALNHQVRKGVPRRWSANT